MKWEKKFNNRVLGKEIYKSSDNNDNDSVNIEEKNVKED